MSNLITLTDIHKRHGVQTLFSGLSLQVSSDERLGILGPNGAGKSTLLRIIAGQTDIDSGRILKRNGLRVSYAEQNAVFADEGEAVLDLARRTAAVLAPYPEEAERLARTALSAMDIDFFDSPVSKLSGGQRKRLQLALCLAESPDLLLLDEPTNHLDIEAIRALEVFLDRADFPWICVSHDRWFLENTVTRIAEINPRYPNGVFSVDGGYGSYCEKRDQFLVALENQHSSLANVVRTEQAWLRQGVKARGTKAKYRIDKAYQLMDSLKAIRARDPGKRIDLVFDSSERKTKRLVEFHSVKKSFGSRAILDNLTLALTSGQALGVLGLNGSGKTTFVRLLTGELDPDSGTIKRAVDLRISHFAQFDGAIDETLALKFFLAENGQSVVFRGESLHVASWAKRFRFPFDRLEQPFGSLSGGERARARISRLMLESPDVLVLDEPTNDLDIETLELLEASLLDFSGAIVLVTHDRFMINRVCTTYLGLDGTGAAIPYADYEQWDREVLQGKTRETEKSAKSKELPARSGSAVVPSPPQKTSKKRLGYLEQREYDAMEEKISRAESEVVRIQEELSAVPQNLPGAELQALCKKLADAQHEVEILYARWSELEAKLQ